MASPASSPCQMAKFFPEMNLPPPASTTARPRCPSSPGPAQVHDTEPSGLPVPNSSHSFWHSEPSTTLLGHRTTEELPETADVVVVGSGITGTFAAWFLKGGLEGDGKGEGGKWESVVMLEAREACWGATGRNGGHCQPFLYASPPSLAAFELANYTFLRSFIAHHAIPCDWTDLRGVHAFLTPALWAEVERTVRELKRREPELLAGVEVIPGGEEAERLRALHVPSACGAVVQEKAASLWPYKLVAFLLEQLLRNFPSEEFNLQTNTPVQGIRRLDTSGESEDKARWELTTPRGVIRARQVLLATNGYTSHLVPAMADLIVPVRGQVGALIPPTLPPPSTTTAAGDEGEGGNRLDISRQHSYCFFADADTDGATPRRDEYLVQRPVPSPPRPHPPTETGTEPGKGYLIFGGARALARNRAVGSWRDDEVEPDVAAFLRRGVIPPLDSSPTAPSPGPAEAGEPEELKADYQWTGIMGYSRDGRPWVGRVPSSLLGSNTDPNPVPSSTTGLFIAAGFSGHGMPNTVLAAHAVVRAMRGEDTGEGNGVEGPGGVRYSLPREFIVTEERVEVARKGERVREVDLEGFGAEFARLGVMMREVGVV